MDQYASSNTDQLLLGIYKSLNQSGIDKFKAIGSQTITVSTATGLTVPDGAKYALMTVESSTTGVVIRYWSDGTVPTSSTGLALYPGDRVELFNVINLDAFKAIAAQAGTHKLQIQYFG